MSDTLNALYQQGATGSVLGAIAHPAVVNPLAAFNSAAEAAGNVYRVRDLQAQQAAGQAFLNSIDPNTGQPNQAQFMRNLAADPRTAMRALETGIQGQALDANTYKLHTQRLSQANDAIGSLIGRFPQGIPQDAAHAAIDQEVSTGLITPAEGEQLKTQFGTDPRQNTITASQIYQHNMTTGQQLDWNYGVSGTATGPGGVQIGTKQNVRTGALAATPQQGVQTGLTAAEGAEVITLTLSDGKQHYFNRSVDANGQPHLVEIAPPQPAGTSPRTGAVPVPPTNIPPRYTPQTAVPSQTALQPSGGGGGGATPTPPQQGGGGLTGPVPGEQEMYQAAVNNRPALNDANVGGQDALELLSKFPTTGPLSDRLNRGLAILREAGGTPSQDISTMPPEAAYQVISKDLMRMVQGRAKAFHNTDAGIETALGASANMEMLPQAIRHVLLQDMGQNRMQQALLNGQDTSGVGFRDRSSNYSTKYDWHAFIWDYMNPQERQAYLKTLGKENSAAFKRFDQSMSEAKSTGVWNPSLAPGQ